MKRIAILQSNYIPWKGYFDIIASVDEFILYDDMQYTKNDWRNRNKIKTPNGLQWITIPVYHSTSQKINQTKISNFAWSKKHYNSFISNYSRAKYFKQYSDWLYTIYELVSNEEFLSRINYLFIKAICELLQIRTKITWSENYHATGSKTDRLLSICKEANCTTYLSGPSAKDYLQEEQFQKENISVEWMNYSGYPEYGQLYPPFEHGVSILDMIFNLGSETVYYLKSAKK